MWVTQINFTDKQVEAIYDAAQKAGLPIAEFIQKALGEAIVAMTKPEDE